MQRKEICAHDDGVVSCVHGIFFPFWHCYSLSSKSSDEEAGVGSASVTLLMGDP
jgi:hypothetical protein